MYLKSMVNSLLLILGLSTAAFATPLEKPHRVSTMENTIQKILDEVREEHQFGAMSLTIIDKKVSKKPLSFHSGTTQKEQGQPLNNTHYYQIGSNTKSFIAALLLKLADEKHISLHDPITKWLPQYSDWQDVTIMNLLNNNSGIPELSQQESFIKVFDGHNVFTPEELVAFVTDIPDPAKRRLFLAGEGWHYSNTNWVLAGMIAEKIGGRPLNELLSTHLFEKVSLSNTHYVPTTYDSQIMPRMVHGYDDNGEDVTDHNASWASSAGAIIATTDDLAQWTYALFHGQVLTHKQLKKMQSLVSIETGKPVAADQAGYGTGVGKQPIAAGDFWGHEGNTEGYHSLYAFFPEHDITITMNANGLKGVDFKPVLNKVVEVLRQKHKRLNIIIN